jgi:hypothetical protein
MGGESNADFIYTGFTDSMTPHLIECQLTDPLEPYVGKGPSHEHLFSLRSRIDGIRSPFSGSF